MTPQLSDLLQGPGPYTTVYTAGPGNRPTSAEESARQSTISSVGAAGAPDADIAAVESALDAAENLPSPTSRYLLVRNGELLCDEYFAAELLSQPVTSHAPTARIVPLLRHLNAQMVYLVVETAREGAAISVRQAQQATPEAEHDVEGETHHLTKVHAGGWSHRRFHRHTEEVWKANQNEVASTVEDLVREHQPTFVVLAGDGAARQLLLELLTAGTQELVIEVDSHTKPEGADTVALDDEVSRAVENQQRQEIQEVTDAAKQNDGARAARGSAAVVAALQQAQVDTLILDAHLLESEETVLALEGPPWVALRGEEDMGVDSVETVPLTEGLARAAILSGGRVLILEAEPQEPGEPRPDEDAHRPLALLRWDNEAQN